MSQPEVLFEEDFSDEQLDLKNTWKLEGTGRAWIEGNSVALQEEPAGQGVVLWLRRDLPSDLCLEFDLSFSNNRGIGVFFLAAKGTQGEDILEDLPPRTGAYPEYTSDRINCYSFSVHRFFPDGRHNEGTNIRRNSGFNLVNHVEPDPVMEAERPCRLRVEKVGPQLRVWVDGELVHHWTDNGEYGEPLGGGKVGFRLRADDSCVMYVSNARITKPDV
ncbi:MAG: DUF1961 family protein [Planctomycetes bacterium]|nr:DUF1961 family protein [Planctomycetota bacterium]